MTKLYEQHKAANNRYLAKLDDIRFRVPKGEREKIREHAAQRGESVNAFIYRAVQETMRRDGAEA